MKSNNGQSEKGEVFDPYFRGFLCGFNSIVIKACHRPLFVMCWKSMKNPHLPCLFVFLSFLCAAALVHAGDYDEYQEAKKAVEGYAKAFGLSDVENVSQYLAQRHIHVNPFGSELTGEALLEDMRSGALQFDFYDLESLELMPLSSGLYLAKGVVHACAHRGGREMSVRFRFVHVLKSNASSEWESIYTQHTKILDSGSACEGIVVDA